jgi:protein gp37
MGATTAIEWADATFNPWIGCTKVSPGCDHCYAEALAKRTGMAEWGPHAARRRTSAAYWRQPLKWNREAEAAGTRPFVFCASLADVFDNQVPDDWRQDLWDLIAETPNLVWLLLTKRPQNVRRLTPVRRVRMGGVTVAQQYWPANAALGVTVVNQDEAERNVPILLSTPGPLFRFVSCEPLLGPIRMDGWLRSKPNRVTLDWVITGGESGAKARPSHPDWHRSLRDQCDAAGVPYLFKQWGEWAANLGHGGVFDPALAGTLRLDDDRRALAFPSAMPVHDGSTGYVGPITAMRRVGKKAAGRVLDGRIHDARPIVPALAEGAL